MKKAAPASANRLFRFVGSPGREERNKDGERMDREGVGEWKCEETKRMRRRSRHDLYLNF